LNEKTGKTYRLPTEAEWEYAAGGGTGSPPILGGSGGGRRTTYAGTSTESSLGDYAWYWKNSGDKQLSGKWDGDKIMKNNCRTHPIKTKKPNALGLYDMSGNVWEWCSDWYGSDYYAQSSNSSNPTGPSSGSLRVSRGGSWRSDPQNCRVAGRIDYSPADRNVSLGFRLARTL
jgi:formylglycine-generating enzyme required for sulfatase activity